jgi:hypothetical protein
LFYAISSHFRFQILGASGIFLQRFVASFVIFVFSLVLLVPKGFASPWIEVGDARLKNNLQYLNDSGAMPISLTTWPIMWADVKKAMKAVDRYELNAAQASALRELEFELRYQTRAGVKRSVELVAASSRPSFRDFASFQRENAELHKNFEWDGESLAVKIQANLVSKPGDDLVQTYFDGSYVAGVLGGPSGEWVLGVGAIDRWWGAGSKSSLILANNARPVPALMLRTKQSQRFETPLLSWLGEWQFVSFLGQMESNRVIPEAKLTGMRFTFKPIDSLEFGLSRAMQWGGEGRDQGFKSFWKSLTSQGENESGDSGNQIAGFDARYNFSLTDDLPSAIYTQLIGEDEAGFMPSKYTFQLGLESTFAFSGGDFIKGFAEYTNTTAGALGSEHPNVAYEHSQFRSGYRYRGRVLGATYDNDSKVVAVGADFQQTDGALSSLSFSYMNLNKDGSVRGNTVSADNQALFFVQASYQQLWLDGLFKVGVSYLTDEPQTAYQDVDRGAVFASWEYRFK